MKVVYALLPSPNIVTSLKPLSSAHKSEKLLRVDNKIRAMEYLTKCITYYFNDSFSNFIKLIVIFFLEKLQLVEQFILVPNNNFINFRQNYFLISCFEVLFSAHTNLHITFHILS